jgi:surface antigen
MKKYISQFLIAALLTTSISACQQNGQGGGFSKQDVGTVLGGATGALVGAQFGKGKGQIVGVAAGTLLGAYLGNQVGASLDKADLQAYNNTSQTALESQRDGQASTWRNPNTGNYGTVTPVRTYADNGTNCREYQQTITVGGKTEKGYGTACRQPDGSWKITQ